MGADLYIQSISDKVDAEWYPKFNEAVMARDAAFPRGSRPDNDPRYEALQAEVDRCYEAMYDHPGYYQDSYNNSNLLWLFNLSYWENLDGCMTKKATITPAGAKRLIKLLKEREPLFRENLAKYELVGNDTREEVEDYFARKLDRLFGFLRTCIELNEPIVCSV